MPFAFLNALNTSATDAGKTGVVADVADSFVTVFDKDGQEVWTQRRGARAATAPAGAPRASRPR